MGLTFNIQNHVFVNIEGHFSFAGDISRYILNRAFFFDIIDNPRIDVFIYFFRTEKANNLFGRVLIAVDFFGI